MLICHMLINYMLKIDNNSYLFGVITIIYACIRPLPIALHYLCCCVCNELGGGRRRLESDAADDGLSGFPKEQQTQSGDGI